MTVELDFAEIKSSLKDYLRSLEQFADYDFEGSNLSALIDLLAKNTHLMALYWNFASNEHWLDSAQLRDSIVSHAKSLNYLPRSRTSSTAVVKITITPDDSPEFITIPRQYAFNATVDGRQLTFSTNSAIVISPSSNVYAANNITLYEGSIVNELFTVDASVSNTNVTSYGNRFTLQSEHIDQTSIEVQVKEDPSDSDYAPYTRYDNLFGVTNSTRAFFVQAYKENQYEVVFGNGIIGKALADSAIVKVSYRDTVGDDGNGVAIFTKALPIDGYTSIAVTTLTRSFGGAERESNEEIALIAPRAYQTQNRCVTAYDYETVVLQEFPEVQSVIAYGGEEIQQYGKVIISVRAHGTDAAISDSLKNRIINFLRTKNMTTEPVVVDADSFFVEVETNLIIDTTIASDFEAIKSDVIETLIGMNETTISQFGDDLRYSKIVTAIDTVNTAIVSSETSLRMIKKITPLTDEEVMVSIDFGQALDTTRLDPAITSSTFTYTHSDGDDYTALIKDNGEGTLLIYTIINGSTVTLVSNIGSVDYNDGTVEMTFEVKGYTNSIKIYARLAGQDILAMKNQFLEVAAEDITVTTEAL